MSTAPRLPHLIIFNPDQWRSDVLGHMGNPAARTPVLDQLAATEAVSFRNAFCQNPVCTPSLSSFMSGWYPHVRGHRTMHHMLRIQHGEPVLLELLRQHGYHVFWGGKNDLVPGQHSYDRFADARATHDRYELDPNWHGPVYEAARGKPGSDTYYSFMVGELHKRPGAHYYQDHDWVNVMEAIRVVREYRGTQPLCLYLPLIYPHPPYAVEEPFFSAIDRAALPPRVPPSSARAGACAASAIAWNSKPAAAALPAPIRIGRASACRRATMSCIMAKQPCAVRMNTNTCGASMNQTSCMICAATRAKRAMLSMSRPMPPSPRSCATGC
jgi:arylsulfatase A-like enzyme